MAEEETALQLQSTFQKMPFMSGKERAIIISSSRCLPAFIFGRFCPPVVFFRLVYLFMQNRLTEIKQKLLFHGQHNQLCRGCLRGLMRCLSFVVLLLLVQLLSVFAEHLYYLFQNIIEDII